MRPFLTVLFALSIFLPSALFAQHAKIDIPSSVPTRVPHAAVKSALQQTPLSLDIQAGRTENLTSHPVVSEPTPFITTEEARIIKAAKLAHKSYGLSDPDQFPGSSRGVTPVMDASFEGNASIDATPSSNSIAVSDDGIIISANNDGIIYFTESGTNVYHEDWQDFFDDGQLTSSFFSPRVLYDPVEERFIMVVLHGKTSATSRVVLSFSKSKNPVDGWNVYKLPGNALGMGNWIDAPSLGISTNEVYVSGNLIEGTDFSQAIVYQINKLDGYSGAILDWQFWSDFFNGPISITPASFGQHGDYGPGIYLVSSAAAGDDAYWFWDLDDDIGGDPDFTGYLMASETYSPPADAAQSGSSDLLETGDSRTLSAFYLDGFIHFVLNIDVGGGRSGISYNRIDVSQQKTTTTHLSDPGADLAYPGVASFATSMADRSATISFLRSNASIFPEFRVVNVDQGMSFSSTTLVKAGETFVDRGAGTERWGEYTGIARRHNSSDPRTWVAGAVGANVSGQLDHTYKTWIGEATNGQMVSVDHLQAPVSFSLSPNPVKENCILHYTLNDAAIVTITLCDIRGQVLETIYHGKPVAGDHKLTIQKGDHPPGHYVLAVDAQGHQLASEKICFIE